jgi:hypothetical protein
LMRSKERLRALAQIPVLVALAAAALVHSVACSDSDSRAITSVTANAQIEGTSPDNSYGYAKGTSWGVSYLCWACVWDRVYFETYSSKTGRYWTIIGACPSGSASRTYQVGQVGSYVYSYIKSYCDGPEASVTAFLGGYCAVAVKP